MKDSNKHANLLNLLNEDILSSTNNILATYKFKDPNQIRLALFVAISNERNNLFAESGITIIYL